LEPLAWCSLAPVSKRARDRSRKTLSCSSPRGRMLKLLLSRFENGRRGFSHFARCLSRAHGWLKCVPPGRGRQAPETLVFRAPKDLKSPSVRREKFTAATDRTSSAGFQVNAFTYQSRAGTDERRYSARTPFAQDIWRAGCENLASVKRPSPCGRSGPGDWQSARAAGYRRFGHSERAASRSERPL
jgi:hypothetical protein